MQQWNYSQASELIHFKLDLVIKSSRQQSVITSDSIVNSKCPGLVLVRPFCFFKTYSVHKFRTTGQLKLTSRMDQLMYIYLLRA